MAEAQDVPEPLVQGVKRCRPHSMENPSATEIPQPQRDHPPSSAMTAPPLKKRKRHARLSRSELMSDLGTSSFARVGPLYFADTSITFDVQLQGDIGRMLRFEQVAESMLEDLPTQPDTLVYCDTASPEMAGRQAPNVMQTRITTKMFDALQPNQVSRFIDETVRLLKAIIARAFGEPGDRPRLLAVSPELVYSVVVVCAYGRERSVATIVAMHALLETLVNPEVVDFQDYAQALDDVMPKNNINLPFMRVVIGRIQDELKPSSTIMSVPCYGCHTELGMYADDEEDTSQDDDEEMSVSPATDGFGQLPRHAHMYRFCSFSCYQTTYAHWAGLLCDD